MVKMKAVFRKPDYGVELGDVPRPSGPEGDEVIYKVKSCGLCHTDSAVAFSKVRGTKEGVILGHEIMGVVTEIGPDVENIKVGDYVIAQAVYGCGDPECPDMKRGNDNHCTLGRPHEGAGFPGKTIDGGFAEYSSAPERALHVLKKEPHPKACILGDAFFVANNGLAKSELIEGDTILLVGGGGVAGAATDLAKSIYGVNVIVADIKEESLEFQKRLGADHTILMDKGLEGIDYAKALKDKVKEIAPQGVQATFDLVGMEPTLLGAYLSTRLGGHTWNIGFHAAAKGEDWPSINIGIAGLMGKASGVKGLWSGPRELNAKVIEYYEEGLLHPEKVAEGDIGTIYDVPKALEELRDGKITGRAVFSMEV